MCGALLTNPFDEPVCALWLRSDAPHLSRLADKEADVQAFLDLYASERIAVDAAALICSQDQGQACLRFLLREQAAFAGM